MIRIHKDIHRYENISCIKNSLDIIATDIIKQLFPCNQQIHCTISCIIALELFFILLDFLFVGCIQHLVF